MIEASNVMPSLVARGPHAVAFGGNNRSGPIDVATCVNTNGNRQDFSVETFVTQPVPYCKAKRAQSDKDDETWIEGKVSNTLNVFDQGDTRTTHAVVECSELSPSVSTGAPFSKTGNERVEADALITEAIPIQDGRAMEKAQGGMGVGKPGDPSYTLDTTGAQAVMPPPLMFKIRGGSPVETGEQGGTPGKAAGKGYLGSEDQAFTVATVQDQWLAQPIPMQDPIPLDSMNLLSRLGPGGENHSLQEFVPGDPMFTLTKGHHHGVADPVAFQPGNLARQAGAAPSTETFPTLTKDSGDQSPHVAHPTVTTCTGQRQGCSSEAMASLAALEQAGAFVPMAVRRLTPVECERLQGFPDNWTRIPWKGKPAEQCPDGPRYKACGNSMAVPVMRWIGERIALVDAKLNPKA